MADKIVHRWTDSDVEYLKSAWGRIDLSEISRVLNRGEGAIKQRAYKLLGTTLDRAAIGNRRTGKTKGKGPLSNAGRWADQPWDDSPNE